MPTRNEHNDVFVTTETDKKNVPLFFLLSFLFFSGVFSFFGAIGRSYLCGFLFFFGPQWIKEEPRRPKHPWIIIPWEVISVTPHMVDKGAAFLCLVNSNDTFLRVEVRFASVMRSHGKM